MYAQLSRPLGYRTLIRLRIFVNLLRFRLSQNRLLLHTFSRYVDVQVQSYIRTKQELIELLEEQKSATINHAVTRGLDPSVRLKPSGTEFLGDIPEHWQVRCLGQIGTLFKGKGGNRQDDVSTGVPCIRYGDLYTSHRYLILNSSSFVSEEKYLQYTALRFGDLVFAGSGETLDEIGKSAVNLMRSKACCGADTILFRSRHEIDPQFLGYAADCHSSIAQKATMGRGITVMHIYRDHLSASPLQSRLSLSRSLFRHTWIK